MSKEGQVNHLWTEYRGWDANRIQVTENKAYKQRRRELKARNKKISKALYHIESRSLLTFSRAATVLNACRKELMHGNLEIALQRFAKAQEITARLSEDMEILARHLHQQEQEEGDDE